MSDSPFLTALAGGVPSRTPVWFMRQAGRFLPEYRALRKLHTFEEMLHDPELIAEVTLQPIKRLDMDAAIFFSDILVLPEALGMDLSYIEGKGPRFGAPVRSVDDLTPYDEGKLDFLAAGVRRVVELSPVPLIGFAGTPWTVALYMVEGQHGKDFLNARSHMRKEPTAFGEVLDVVADTTIEYLDVQIRAGAQAIQLFDSWGGLLGPDEHMEVAHTRTERVIKEVRRRHPGLPVILFSRGTGGFLPRILAATEADAINPDWTTDLPALRKLDVCPKAVQGNFDPTLLFAAPEVITEKIQAHIKAVGSRGFVLNAGHGMNPDLDPDLVKAAVVAAHAVDTGA